MNTKFYFLVNRKWYGLDYTPGEDPRDVNNIFYEDEITHIFVDEDDYVDYIKNNIFTYYEGLPMKNLCCKDFIGLTINDVYFLGEAYADYGLDPHIQAIDYKQNKDDDHVDKKNLIRYADIFNEPCFNDVIKKFFRDHIRPISNFRAYFFDIPLIKDGLGNWIFDKAEINKRQREAKEKEARKNK